MDKSKVVGSQDQLNGPDPEDQILFAGYDIPAPIKPPPNEKPENGIIYNIKGNPSFFLQDLNSESVAALNALYPDVVALDGAVDAPVEPGENLEGDAASGTRKVGEAAATSAAHITVSAAPGGGQEPSTKLAPRTASAAVSHSSLASRSFDLLSIPLFASSAGRGKGQGGVDKSMSDLTVWQGISAEAVALVTGHGLPSSASAAASGFAAVASVTPAAVTVGPMTNASGLSGTEATAGAAGVTGPAASGVNAAAGASTTTTTPPTGTAIAAATNTTAWSLLGVAPVDKSREQLKQRVLDVQYTLAATLARLTPSNGGNGQAQQQLAALQLQKERERHERNAKNALVSQVIDLSELKLKSFKAASAQDTTRIIHRRLRPSVAFLACYKSPEMDEVLVASIFYFRALLKFKKIQDTEQKAVSDSDKKGSMRPLGIRSLRLEDSGGASSSSADGRVASPEGKGKGHQQIPADTAPIEHADFQFVTTLPSEMKGAGSLSPLEKLEKLKREMFSVVAHRYSFLLMLYCHTSKPAIERIFFESIYTFMEEFLKLTFTEKYHSIIEEELGEVFRSPSFNLTLHAKQQQTLSRATLLSKAVRVTAPYIQNEINAAKELGMNPPYIIRNPGDEETGGIRNELFSKKPDAAAAAAKSPAEAPIATPTAAQPNELTSKVVVSRSFIARTPLIADLMPTPSENIAALAVSMKEEQQRKICERNSSRSNTARKSSASSCTSSSNSTGKAGEAGKSPTIFDVPKFHVNSKSVRQFHQKQQQNSEARVKLARLRRPSIVSRALAATVIKGAVAARATVPSVTASGVNAAGGSGSRHAIGNPFATAAAAVAVVATSHADSFGFVIPDLTHTLLTNTGTPTSTSNFNSPVSPANGQGSKANGSDTANVVSEKALLTALTTGLLPEDTPVSSRSRKQGNSNSGHSQAEEPGDVSYKYQQIAQEIKAEEFIRHQREVNPLYMGSVELLAYCNRDESDATADEFTISRIVLPNYEKEKHVMALLAEARSMQALGNAAGTATSGTYDTTRVSDRSGVSRSSSPNRQVQFNNLTH